MKLLLQLPLLHLGTDGAAAIEAGADIVRSAAGAPGKSTAESRPCHLPRDFLHSLPRTRPAGTAG